MDLQSAIKAVMHTKRIKCDELAGKIGMTRRNLYAKLNDDHAMSVDNALKFLDALDCELVIRGHGEGSTELVVTRAFRNAKEVG